MSTTDQPLSNRPPLTVVLPGIVLACYAVLFSIAFSNSSAPIAGGFIRLLSSGVTGQLLLLASITIILFLIPASIHVLWLYGLIAMFRRKPMGLLLGIAGYWVVFGTTIYAISVVHRSVMIAWSPIITIIALVCFGLMLHMKASRAYCQLSHRSGLYVGLAGLLLSALLTIGYVAPVYGAVALAKKMGTELSAQKH